MSGERADIPLSTTVSGSARPGVAHVALPIPIVMSRNLLTAAVPTAVAPTPTIAPEGNGFNGPVVTLVSALPETVYSDEKDTEPKPDGYITVQLKILQWLDKNPADTITTQQAAVWTSNIEPDGRPEPEHALSLCYYMRTQGFDIYSRMNPDKHSFALYIATSRINGRVLDHDVCYWEQNWNTGAVTDRGYYHTGRRGAMSSMQVFARSHQALAAPVRAAGVHGLRADDGAWARMDDTLAQDLSEEYDEDNDDMSDGAVDRENDGPSVPAPAATERVRLQRRLEALLSRPTSAEIQDEIVSIMGQLEQFHAQG